jgi:signal transduction histidine kinase
MSDDQLLLSTVLSLPDTERAAVERALAEVARAAALGGLAADIAHDVANPLFGVLGLVELLLDDATPGSEDEDRLRLLRRTVLDLKGSVGALLDFARPAPAAPARAELATAATSALGLVRHGAGKALEVEERYGEAEAVACPEPLLVEAVLHLLLAARAGGGPLELDVEGRTLRVAPAGPESLGELAARRIAAGQGGSLTRNGGAFVLTLPPAA